MSSNSGEGNFENLTTAQNDAERWVIATYAMWSEYYSKGKEL